LELEVSCLASSLLCGVGLGGLEVEGSFADFLVVDAPCCLRGMRS
jgi:hypothetical protein